MKKFGLLMVAIPAIAALSFSYYSVNDSQISENIELIRGDELKLNTEKSVLKWKGVKTKDHFHTGTLKFSSGSAIMENKAINEGAFNIDMGSIRISDKMPDEKISYLAKHLMSADFFNVEKFPSVSVSVDGYKDGKLSTKISLMGMSIDNDIPVSFSETVEGFIIDGKFDLDLKTLKIPGLQPDPESGEAISSIVNYELHLVLNK